VLTPAQLKSFKNVTSCDLCSRSLSEDCKVRNYNNISGMYRGTAHNSCNILYLTPRFVPVFQPNLSGYDSNFITREYEGYDISRITFMPNFELKYIFLLEQVGSISVSFVDAFRFMPSS
ncbi:hypothetical protein AAG570_012687, partial [Ranatra chinensis]